MSIDFRAIAVIMPKEKQIGISGNNCSNEIITGSIQGRIALLPFPENMMGNDGVNMPGPKNVT